MLTIIAFIMASIMLVGIIIVAVFVFCKRGKLKEPGNENKNSNFITVFEDGEETMFYQP